MERPHRIEEGVAGLGQHGLLLGVELGRARLGDVRRQHRQVEAGRIGRHVGRGVADVDVGVIEDHRQLREDREIDVRCQQAVVVEVAMEQLIGRVVSGVAGPDQRLGELHLGRPEHSLARIDHRRMEGVVVHGVAPEGQ